MDEQIVQSQELQLFVEAMQLCHGIDFKGYQPASLQRRVTELAKQQGVQHISELIPKVFHQPNFADLVVSEISVGVTEFFRDPELYRILKNQLLPQLASYPAINVWSAGCATGEEAYSLAIIFKQAGLLAKTRIYATDMNAQAIAYAKQGIYPIKTAQQGSLNYHAFSPSGSFSDYFTARYQQMKLHDELLQAVSFFSHNLSTDAAFCEAHLIVCKNVLIYFNQDLQNRSLELFKDSLVRKGFMLLGTKEDCRVKGLNAIVLQEKSSVNLYQKNNKL